MKTQFTDFWYSGKTPRSSRCSEKKQAQLPESPKKTENKETETQKTNSIPFAKPIRRPMKLEGYKELT